MQIQIPHFRRRAGNGADRHSEFIEMDGECIHKIENLDDFYETFGYTAETAKSGLLPDEFIWEEYIKGNALTFTECLQVHLIEYLRQHSDTFRRRYDEQARSWVASYAEAISSRGILCAACKKNSALPGTLNDAACHGAHRNNLSVSAHPDTHIFHG